MYFIGFVVLLHFKKVEFYYPMLQWISTIAVNPSTVHMGEGNHYTMIAASAHRRIHQSFDLFIEGSWVIERSKDPSIIQMRGSSTKVVLCSGLIRGSYVYFSKGYLVFLGLEDRRIIKLRDSRLF